MAILFAAIYVLSAPIGTILAPSSKTLNDVYLVLFLGMLALCLLGFVSAYVKRLHDIGLRGYWALVALLLVPAVALWSMTTYATYRFRQDGAFNTGDINAWFEIAWVIPLLLGLWKGDSKQNRFGPAPQPVEHFTASTFNIAAVVGAALILIPTSIYAGLFQPGVWLSRQFCTHHAHD